MQPLTLSLSRRRGEGTRTEYHELRAQDRAAALPLPARGERAGVRCLIGAVPFGIPNDIQARARTGAALGCRIRIKRRRGTLMTRAYNVVDADGHILEPLDLWDKYIDPK